MVVLKNKVMRYMIVTGRVFQFDLRIQNECNVRMTKYDQVKCKNKDSYIRITLIKQIRLITGERERRSSTVCPSMVLAFSMTLVSCSVSSNNTLFVYLFSNKAIER